ncbi:hypothetical protein [Emticicia sp. C21]|uniref:hypothetical protein n=1 Tax=Emticicia sp. C21 TaxID=2302915 RepID=UPI000E34DFBD|nr:hypothetical protein [Emticicia sp. C21]RFS16017.1 hypothetical protein D0T08_14075 [Emticicia sp. C21]
MISIVLITIGTFLYYSKSKYFPKSFKSIKSNSWINLIFILAGTGLLVVDWGWASGVLLALCIYMLAIVALQLALVVRERLSSKS